MKVREIQCKTILNRSRIPCADYCVNPYTGCGHGCRYCYADFMRRYSGHNETWGSFADVKVNAAKVLEKQLPMSGRGTVYLSSVTDPYQPLESRYKITRQCLGVLLEHDFPVSIQTKSALVIRDLDIIKQFNDIEVGFTICMDDSHARKLEPGASPPSKRVAALKKLHDAGISTFVFLGPVIPHVTDYKRIIRDTQDCTDRYLIDRLNVKGCAAKNGMEMPDSSFYERVRNEILLLLKNRPCHFCW